MLEKISCIVIDVDGTLTDGGICYDDNGNEWKKFNTRDGAGFFALKAAGIRTIVLTGRHSGATERRMHEMKVDLLKQDVPDKAVFLREYMVKENLAPEEMAFIGDEMNDYAAMQMVGFAACPADACEEILAIADYASPKRGGEGVLRDVAKYILEAQGTWERILREIYHAQTDTSSN